MYFCIVGGVKMPCPFISRLPSTYVRNYAGNLLKTYAEHCPYASQVVSIYLTLGFQGASRPFPSGQPSLFMSFLF